MIDLQANIRDPHTELDREHCALLLVDMQNDFVSPQAADPKPDIDEVVPNVLALAGLFRAARRPVLYAVRLYPAGSLDVDLCRRQKSQEGRLAVCRPGTWGAEILDGLTPPGTRLDGSILLQGGMQRIGEDEYVFYKPRFSAFHRTALHAFLQEKRLNSLVIAGTTFPNCVRATQLSAVDYDYHTALVMEACTQADEAGVRIMQSQGVQILGLDEVRQFLAISDISAP